MSELKTKRNSASVMDFLMSVEHPIRQSDALVLLDVYQEICQCEAQMWGPSIVGFGHYDYRNSQGKTLQWMRSGFSPRKQYISLYLMRGVEKHPQLLRALGKHKHGKSCLNINKLADIDMTILKQLIVADLKAMNEAHPL